MCRCLAGQEVGAQMDRGLDLMGARQLQLKVHFEIIPRSSRCSKKISPEEKDPHPREPCALLLYHCHLGAGPG